MQKVSSLDLGLSLCPSQVGYLPCKNSAQKVFLHEVSKKYPVLQNCHVAHVPELKCHCMSDVSS